MWSNQIALRILDYTSRYYAEKERAYFAFDLNGLIIGGSAGLSLLLGGAIRPTDTIEVYDSNPISRARQLADTFYDRTKREFVHMRTTVANREFEVKEGTRIIAKVMREATASLIPIPYKWRDMEFFLVAPNLHLINILRNYSDPTRYDDRDDNRLVIRALIDKMNELTPGLILDKTPPMRDATWALKNVSNDARHYLLDCVHVYSTMHQAIYVTNRSTMDFINNVSRIFGGEVNRYEVMLPNELFLNKVVIRVKMKRGGGTTAPDPEDIDGGGDSGYRFIFYNEAFYDIIGYTNIKGVRQAIPSVVARYMLMEDNASLSLFKRGHGEFANRDTYKEILDEALEEKFPRASMFYGYVRNKESMKKSAFASAANVHREYFPASRNST